MRKALSARSRAPEASPFSRLSREWKRTLGQTTGRLFPEYLLCIQRISAPALTSYILHRTEEPFGSLHVECDEPGLVCGIARWWFRWTVCCVTFFRASSAAAR